MIKLLCHILNLNQLIVETTNYFTLLNSVTFAFAYAKYERFGGVQLHSHEL